MFVQSVSFHPTNVMCLVKRVFECSMRRLSDCPQYILICYVNCMWVRLFQGNLEKLDLKNKYNVDCKFFFSFCPNWFNKWKHCVKKQLCQKKRYCPNVHGLNKGSSWYEIWFRISVDNPRGSWLLTDHPGHGLADLHKSVGCILNWTETSDLCQKK